MNLQYQIYLQFLDCNFNLYEIVVTFSTEEVVEEEEEDDDDESQSKHLITLQNIYDHYITSCQRDAKDYIINF
jgi:hypothetical protein